MDKRVGNYSFIIGVIIAIVLGIVSLGTATAWLTSLLVILGLIVGFLNVGGKDTKEFMMVATVLTIAAYAGGAPSILGEVQIIGMYLQGVFVNILAFVIPAVVVVGLKEVSFMRFVGFPR